YKCLNIRKFVTYSLFVDIMKLYELTYLISPQLSEKDLKDAQERMNSLIQEEGGILNEVNLPTKKRLAYPVKKEKEAFGATLSFNLKPEKLKNLVKNLKSEVQILRYLILTKPHIKEISGRGKRLAKKPKLRKKKVELKEIEKKLEEILGED
ncbi:MAG: 30S ribosomal protein S6, partial [Candidatus Paceibacterales bacterium]